MNVSCSICCTPQDDICIFWKNSQIERLIPGGNFANTRDFKFNLARVNMLRFGWNTAFKCCEGIRKKFRGYKFWNFYFLKIRDTLIYISNYHFIVQFSGKLCDEQTQKIRKINQKITFLGAVKECNEAKKSQTLKGTPKTYI